MITAIANRINEIENTTNKTAQELEFEELEFEKVEAEPLINYVDTETAITGLDTLKKNLNELKIKADTETDPDKMLVINQNISDIEKQIANIEAGQTTAADVLTPEIATEPQIIGTESETIQPTETTIS